MTEPDYRHLANELASQLNLSAAPLAITFTNELPDSVSAFSETYPEPAANGRTGAVSAGCVFWMRGVERTFSTVAEDHGNCSVGSFTHGLKTAAEIANADDVGALVTSEWVPPDALDHIPAVSQAYQYVIYGPLYEADSDPDVVLIRVNPKQAMVLSDAVADIRFEGKPQCHIVPLAREENIVAVSVGCMLSRVRTGMTVNEMTCAIPASRLTEVVESLSRAHRIDDTVAEWASEDSARFRQGSETAT